MLRTARPRQGSACEDVSASTGTKRLSESQPSRAVHNTSCSVCITVLLRALMRLIWLGFLSTFTFVRVPAHGAAPQEQALAGLYRTIDTVSVFEGIAIRFTQKARCSMIFLAGMPRQGFRYSILTGFVNTELVTSPAGLKCYHVLWPPSSSSFRRVNALKEMLGNPGDISLASITACFSEKSHMLMVDGSGHAMQKLSGESLGKVDLPLGPPPPALYVNDEPASRLGDVVVEIGNFTAKIVVRSSNNFEVLGSINEYPSRVRRCFRLVFPWPAQSLPDGLPFGHPLRKLNWNDAWFCRDPQLVTYLVIGRVRVRLKKDTPSGVYRTNYPISVFEGIAVRFIAGTGEGSMVFLAGMPEQGFRSSIETSVTQMEVLSVSGGLTCYRLQEGPLQAGLQTASAFTVNHGRPWNFTADDFAPCFSDGLSGAFLMVQGSGYVMRKISDDPHEVLDLPLQPPPSGVYVNDVPVPGLEGVTVKIDDKSECSTKIAVTGGISLKFSTAVFEEDERAQRRCYRLVNPNSRCPTAGLPAEHFLTKLGWNLVQLCRDSRLVTYLLLDGVTIRLRQKGSASSKLPVSATSVGSEARPIEVEAINSPRKGEGSAYEVTPVTTPTQDGPVVSLPSLEPSVSERKLPNFDMLLPSTGDDSRHEGGHLGGLRAELESIKNSNGPRVKRQKINHTEGMIGTPTVGPQGEEIHSIMEPDRGATGLASSSALQVERAQEGVPDDLLGSLDFLSDSSFPIGPEGLSSEGILPRSEIPASGWPSVDHEGVVGNTNPGFDQQLLSSDVMWSPSLSAGSEVPQSSATENTPSTTAIDSPEFNFDDLMTIDGKGLMYLLDPERQ